MRRGVLALIALTSGCGGKLMPEADADGAPLFVPPEYCNDSVIPPSRLECTGLYADTEAKVLARGVRAFAPAVPLWSDGAEKYRWIQLPEGTTVDASDSSEWRFPVGTKAWKEFQVAGKRVETRLFQKVLENNWTHATYAWNEDESATTLSRGGDVAGPAGVYHIPTRDECDDCHKGRTDRLLGFEQVSLGLDGATGLTLAKLVDEDLISPAPSRTSLTLGDDGTGIAAEPMKWLHINCGTTCHNGNPTAVASGAKMDLRLDPERLDGRASSDFALRETTVSVAVNNPNWQGRTRIIPGDPDQSLLVQLISNRGTNNPAGNQMPPIASRVVDQVNVQKVTDWIRSMPAGTPGPP